MQRYEGAGWKQSLTPQHIYFLMNPPTCFIFFCWPPVFLFFNPSHIFCYPHHLLFFSFHNPLRISNGITFMIFLKDKIGKTSCQTKKLLGHYGNSFMALQILIHYCRNLMVKKKLTLLVESIPIRKWKLSHRTLCMSWIRWSSFTIQYISGVCSDNPPYPAQSIIIYNCSQMIFQMLHITRFPNTMHVRIHGWKQSVKRVHLYKSRRLSGVEV